MAFRYLYGPGDNRTMNLAMDEDNGTTCLVVDAKASREISGVLCGHLRSLLADRPQHGESRFGKSNTC